MKHNNGDAIREEVRNKYGNVASATSQQAGNDKPSCCGGGSVSIIEGLSKMMGYSKKDLEQTPEQANMGLGCGNPGKIASLKPGETVLDLGSGGGFDCFLAAGEVGQSGKVIGVDMTPEMVSLARKNAAQMNAQNVEFRLGEMEHLPVADNSVDVIISNCAINLSPQKQEVFQEAFRVLKSGGRLAISDILAIKPLPAEFTQNSALVCGCIGGAESVENIKKILKGIGFDQIDIELAGQSRELIKQWVPGKKVEEYVRSAAIRAKKP